MPDSILADLDPEQRLVAEALSGPVLVLAGAGTGKTRAITHRIAHAVLTGRHRARAGMAVTFTNRAAGEMRHRLLGLGVPNVAVRTFHAAALGQLRHFWPQAVGGGFPELVASKARLVDRACREIGVQVSKTTVRDLASEIEWAGSCLVLPGDYPQAAQRAGRSAVGTATEELDLPGVARVMSAYAQVKSQAHVLDFEDVLLATIAMLGDRPDLLDQVQDAYRWFTVDEFQDITPAQERLLALWVGERDDVCVVGDPSQTIYSFAGADPAAFERFVGSWPHTTQIRLDRNYRSTPQILAVANAINRAGQVARDKRAPASSASRPGGVDLSPVVLRAHRGPGPAPAVVTCADDADEAETVAVRIRAMAAEGVPLRGIAVLLRTNAASEKLEVALAQSGIAYTMRGAERFFERPEVREAVVRLRGRLAGGSRSDLATGVPPAVDDVAAPLLGESGKAPWGLVTSEVVAVLSGMGWEAGGAATGGAARERWESLAALVALAEEVESAGGASLASVVAELERRSALSHAPTVDGVTVATLHAAKGLEWPVVFIVGCSEGGLPIVHADTPERVEEERRLFFVGVTRAQERLVLSWAMTRNGSGRHREPSRFLAEMRRSQTALTDRATSSGIVRQGQSQPPRERRRRPPSRCRVCGAGLLTAPERTLGRCRNCPGAPDEELAGRLRAWRHETANEREVPAFVVFTDLTLAALAERKPRDQAALLDIPGIGPAKVELYGEALLGLVAHVGPEQPKGGGLARSD